MQQQAGAFNTLLGDIDELGARRTAYIADGYEVHLYKAGFAPTRDSVAADFAAEEADFTGYAAAPQGGAGHLFDPVGVDADGNAVFSTADIFFQATDAVSPNVIGGAWVESTAGVVRRFFVFPQPVNMDAALKFIDMQIFESMGIETYAQINS